MLFFESIVDIKQLLIVFWWRKIKTDYYFFIKYACNICDKLNVANYFVFQHLFHHLELYFQKKNDYIGENGDWLKMVRIGMVLNN